MSSTGPATYVPPSPPSPPAKVTQPVFTAVNWSGLAISTCFVLFRAWARWKTFHRYFLDDLFVLLAWILVLVSAILWHFAGPALFETADAASGQLLIAEAPNLIPDTVYFVRVVVAVLLIFYTCLWSIKISFLIFFRRIMAGTHFKSHLIHWWVVFALTLASWVSCIGDFPYSCFVTSYRDTVIRCESPDTFRKQRILLEVNTALDILTDILIMSIPIAMLWNLKMALRRKLALAGIFSLTVNIMIIAIVRVVETSTQSNGATNLDSTWLFLWTSVESSVAVIVACLASFRSLFTKQETRSRPNQHIHVSSNNIKIPLRPLRSAKARSAADDPDATSLALPRAHRDRDNQRLPGTWADSRECFLSAESLQESMA